MHGKRLVLFLASEPPKAALRLQKQTREVAIFNMAFTISDYPFSLQIVDSGKVIMHRARRWNGWVLVI